MAEKVLRLVVAFNTTTAAISMEKGCKEKGIGGRLIPVPRQISASCGLAWMADLADREILESFTAENGIDVSGWYEIEFNA
ncbi:MAG: DUF3343 domain-containing protein [Firmicutes bacterium]|nr:DUF3343 domain-containing protein [Bacillota bacterium]